MTYLSESYVIGNGPPVVLLHSSMSSKEQWGKLSEKLSKEFTVLAFDLSGYGAGVFPENAETFNLEQEADRIDHLISRHLGNRKYHLMGHSYGGATALRLAYKKPERIYSLAIYEPVAFHLLPKDDPDLAIIITLAKRIAELTTAAEPSAATRLFVDFWSGSGTYDSLSPKRQQSLDRFIAKVTLDFQAGVGEPLTLNDYAESLSIPVSLIAGKRSPQASRKIAENIAASLPQVEFHWVDGGHMAPITHAEAVNDIWHRFLCTR